MRTIDISSNLVTDGIVEECENGLVILRPANQRPFRRVLFVNNYGGAEVWKKIKSGLVATHHLWGCLELVHMGYEVALAEAVPDFNPRRPIPHDLGLLQTARSWLQPDDIIYCGHNVLFYLPLLRSLNLLRRHVVSLLFAREPLAFSDAHSAVIALTPAAATHAAKIAPKALIAHLGWGVELGSYPTHPYRPEYMLHCGIAGRDFATLNKAALQSRVPIRIIAAWPIDQYVWPPTVAVIEGGAGYNHQDKKVMLSDLLGIHYAGSAASLIVTIPNPRKNHALGFTNLIEAMAMSQPIIHARTGAVADEIDVEEEGCGLSIPPQDPIALARAMQIIFDDPFRAEAMGKAARKLCEQRYNIKRYAARLHELFASL